jgi:methanogenic corrinoid protein MtbC1
MRGKLTVPARAPVVVLATLSGEAHGLGLQMLSLYMRVLGVRAEVIGTHTPAHEIAAGASELGAAGVGLSVSLATGGVNADRVIADLRRQLPKDVRLLVGGRGARGVRRGPRGVDHVADWPALERWCESLSARGEC